MSKILSTSFVEKNLATGIARVSGMILWDISENRNICGEENVAFVSQRNMKILLWLMMQEETVDLVQKIELGGGGGGINHGLSGIYLAHTRIYRLQFCFKLCLSPIGHIAVWRWLISTTPGYIICQIIFLQL
ncbi:hypothetical protein ACJX0J_013792, partial [Zea mays]